MTSSLRIGLGATVLARGLASNGHLDGIGIYMRELCACLGNLLLEWRPRPLSLEISFHSWQGTLNAIFR